VVVRDLEEARLLAGVISGEIGTAEFDGQFGHKCSPGFDAVRDLQRIGVVNQTTMLATETREIARLLRQALVARFGDGTIADHFADTSDTLCYATNENQNATCSLTKRGADLALVVGGYNSSNTSHIVELCEAAMPTYFVDGEDEILSGEKIRHFVLKRREVEVTEGWLPAKRPVEVVLTSGASCPDALLDGVLLKVLTLVNGAGTVSSALEPYPDPEPQG
jgi:4-hydroxy-3-methylbut-2-enyl diphosphate reductase